MRTRELDLVDSYEAPNDLLAASTAAISAAASIAVTPASGYLARGEPGAGLLIDVSRWIVT